MLGHGSVAQFALGEAGIIAIAAEATHGTITFAGKSSAFQVILNMVKGTLAFTGIAFDFDALRVIRTVRRQLNRRGASFWKGT